MRQRLIYYFSLQCHRGSHPNKGRPSDQACRMDCPHFDWDGHRYYCRQSGRCGPVIGRSSP